MKETTTSDTLADVPWPTSARRMPVASTSMLPGSEKAPSTAADLMKHARDGAHDTLDRLASRAAPAAQRLDEQVSAAGNALRTGKDRLRDTRDEWMGSARSSVMKRPLTFLAAAIVLGAVVSRVTRWGASPS